MQLTSAPSGEKVEETILCLVPHDDNIYVTEELE